MEDAINYIKQLERRIETLERFSGGGGSVGAGFIQPFAASTVPTGWLECDGSAVSRTTYADLFTVIGTTYGSGDGSTTFNLPDLKGKVVAGYDSTDTDFDAIGETGGAKTHKHKGWGDADSGETAGDLRATVGSPTGDASRLGFVALSAINPNTGSGGETVTYRVGGSNLVGGGFSHFTKVLGYTSTKSSLQPYMALKYVISY